MLSNDVLANLLGDMEKYNMKKLKNQEVLKFLEVYLTEKGFTRLLECSNFLTFALNGTFEHKKLVRSNSCGNRFCPFCTWRRAKRDVFLIDTMMQYIYKKHEKEFIFITLTAPNVTGDELKDEITYFNKAFANLLKRKEIEKINRGCVRKLEVTYSKKRNDFHPHFHIIMAVDRSYFSSRNYLRQSVWLNLWREVMKDNSITQVDVRRIKIGLANEAVKEVAKYTAKDADYTVSQDVFDIFYRCLKGRQLLTFNGLFKEAKKKYDNKELEEYKVKDSIFYEYVYMSSWSGKEYKPFQNPHKISQEDLLKYNHPDVVNLQKKKTLA